MDRQLKTAFLGENRFHPQDGGFSNLFYEAKALDADVIPYRDVTVERLKGYDIIICGDIKDYRVYDGKVKMIRDAYPDVLIGWRQESEVSNIFRRHKVHGNMSGSEEHLDIDPLKVWENCQLADFIIVHNKGDYSESFYNIYSGGKPVFSLPPFVPVNKLTRLYKPREKKQKKISIGFHYGWKEGGLMGYIVAGQSKYNDFSLSRMAHDHLNSDKMKWVIELIDNNFYKKKVENVIKNNRVRLCGYFANCYLAINLREPTACRTNVLSAIAGTPMIGNEQSDVQQILFPYLCVNKYDLVKIDCLMNKLIKDTNFYDHCVKRAQYHLHEVNIEESSKIMRDNVYKIYNERKGKK